MRSLGRYRDPVRGGIVVMRHPYCDLPKRLPAERPTEEEVRRLLVDETERVLLNLKMWNLVTWTLLSGGRVP